MKRRKGVEEMWEKTRDMAAGECGKTGGEG